MLFSILKLFYNLFWTDYDKDEYYLSHQIFSSHTFISESKKNKRQNILKIFYHSLSEKNVCF